MAREAAAGGKRRPGRPKKEADARLEQFSIRLSPRLKLGLELLARAQHRSLSQAVEWAVNVGLQSYEFEEQTLLMIVNQVWQRPTEGSRAIELAQIAPGLLTFEDRATWELVSASADMKHAREQIDAARRKGASPSEVKPLEEGIHRALAFAAENWTDLRTHAARLSEEGWPLVDLDLKTSAEFGRNRHQPRG